MMGILVLDISKCRKKSTPNIVSFRSRGYVKEGKREGEREGGRKGGRERGKEGKRERGKEGGRKRGSRMKYSD